MNTTKKTLQLCWQHAWRYPKYVIGLLIMIPIANILLRLVPPLIAADVLKRLSQGDFTKGDVWGSFGSDIVLYAILTALGGIVAWRIVIYLIWKMEGYVVSDLYRRMFSKYMQLGADFHSNSFGGSLVSQTSKLSSSYIRLQDTFAFNFYLLLIAFVFISTALYSRVPEFVWVMWGFSVVFILFALLLSREVRRLAALEASAQNKTTGYLADAVTNVMAIKSFASSAYEERRFAKATENTRLRTMDHMRATTKRDIASSSITTTVGVLALIVAIISVVNYGADIGTVFLLVAYTADITERLWDLSTNALRNYNRAIGDAQEAIITLHTVPSIQDRARAKKLVISSGKINLENVTFAHNESEDSALFTNFSLNIEPGTKVGLVGRSGSGKTTLTKLLLRFMDIDSGKITIDGQDISGVSQEDLRGSIAYVPQEPLLFHRSLSENIGYGRAGASQDQIIAAAKLAHAHEFIKDLPKGYDTLVGERGVKLSGGQRQRVAIARAMIKNVPIILLDEATSALDSESEKLIQDALKKLMADKTAIVIAHRLSTVQKMDRIIVLDDGKIVEDGSHQVLLAQKGAYSELWKHQSGGFLED